MPEYKLTLIRPNQKLKVIWRTAFVQRRNPASREFFLKRFEYGMQRGEKMDKREVRAHALAELKAKIEAAKRERAIKRGLIVANLDDDGSSVKRNPVVKATKFKRVFQRVLRSSYKALDPSRVLPLYSFIGLRTKRPALITPFAMEAIRQSFTVRMDPKYSKLKIRIWADLPVTRKPDNMRMGKGKGEVKYWTSVVPSYRIINEGRLWHSYNSYFINSSATWAPIYDSIKNSFGLLKYKVPGSARFVINSELYTEVMLEHAIRRDVLSDHFLTYSTVLPHQKFKIFKAMSKYCSSKLFYLSLFCHSKYRIFNNINLIKYSFNN